MESRTDTVLQSSVSCTQNHPGHGQKKRQCYNAQYIASVLLLFLLAYLCNSKTKWYPEIKVSALELETSYFVSFYPNNQWETTTHTNCLLTDCTKVKIHNKSNRKQQQNLRRKRSHSSFSSKGTNLPWKEFCFNFFFFTVFWSSFFSQCWQSTLFPFFMS